MTNEPSDRVKNSNKIFNKKINLETNLPFFAL